MEGTTGAGEDARTTAGEPPALQNSKGARRCGRP